MLNPPSEELTNAYIESIEYAFFLNEAVEKEIMRNFVHSELRYGVLIIAALARIIENTNVPPPEKREPSNEVCITLRM